VNLVHVPKHFRGNLIIKFGLLVRCLGSEGVHIRFEGGCRSITHHSTFLTWWKGRRSRRRERVMAVMMTAVVLVAQMVNGRCHQIVGFVGTLP